MTCDHGDDNEDGAGDKWDDDDSVDEGNNES